MRSINDKIKLNLLVFEREFEHSKDVMQCLFVADAW